ALDRWGPRRLMLAVAAAFGAILVASSAMDGPVGLVAGFIGVRLAGQGALNLVATTTVALYVTRRRGSAIGLASALGTAGISLAPLLLERLIAGGDWRTVWFFEGIAVWALVIPVTLLVLPRRPVAEPTPAVDPQDADRPGAPGVDWTPRRAM
ncbi:MFS transporter, partial [Corallococcus terminator]